MNPKESSTEPTVACFNRSAELHFSFAQQQEELTSLLLGIDTSYQTAWTCPLTPWEDEQTARSNKPHKRKNIFNDSYARRLSPTSLQTKRKVKETKPLNGLNKPFSVHRKTSDPESDREKRKSLKRPGGFKYYMDISQYIKEYRHMRKKLGAEYRDCTCHGGYSLEDVDKIYKNLEKQGKSQFTSRNRRPIETSSLNTSRHSGTITGKMDEREDSNFHESPETSYSPPPRKFIHLPEVKKGSTRSSPEGKMNIGILRTSQCVSGLIFSSDSEFNIDYLVERHLGRQFYGFDQSQFLHKKHSKQEHPCRIVKLSIPDKHTVTRVLCDGVVEHRAEVIDWSNYSTPIERNPPKTDVDLPEDDSISSITNAESFQSSSFLSNAVSSLTSSVSDDSTSSQNSSASKGTVVSANIRELNPFSRNGVHSKAQRVQRHEKVKKAEGKRNPVVSNQYPQNLNEPSCKQAVPWKTLRYLGYKPSMRKYLHEIYTPVGKERSNTPFIMGSNKIFSPSADAKKTQDKDVAENSETTTRSYQAFAENSVTNRLLNRARQRQQNDKTISINRYIPAPYHENPKLAIISNCKTVVKPQVSMKKLIIT